VTETRTDETSTTGGRPPTGPAAGAGRRPPASADPLAAVIPLTARSRAAHPAGRTRTRSAPGDGRDHPAAAHRAEVVPRQEPSRPPAATLAALLVRLSAEVAAGRRPLRQLEPLLAPTLVRRLAAGLRPGVSRPRELPVVRQVVVGDPTPSGAVEATVLLEREGRVTAVAVRLERHLGAWRATEMTAPESGYAPLPTRSSPRVERGPDAFDEAEAEATEITPDRDTA
jgi:hypothetical protein